MHVYVFAQRISVNAGTLHRYL